MENVDVQELQRAYVQLVSPIIYVKSIKWYTEPNGAHQVFIALHSREGFLPLVDAHTELEKQFPDSRFGFCAYESGQTPLHEGQMIDNYLARSQPLQKPSTIFERHRLL